MKSHFHDKIDMKTLSAMANLTPSSFSRLFKKTMGESPIEYLTRIRIDSAKTLLSQKGSKVREVSAAVGYEDEFHFSRIFHRAVGVSPTFYMKRNRLKVAVASCLQLQNSLLSLGVEPVASVNCCKNPGMGEVEYEYFFTNQWEQLVRSAPDILIGDAYHKHLYDKFCEIAPSVVLASDGNWIVNYRKMADILGRKPEAEQTIHQLELRVTEAKGLLQRKLEGKTVCVIQVSHDGIGIQGAIDHPLNELLYRDLGLRPGRSVPLHAKMLELPPEWLPPLEADYLFILQKHERAGSDHIYERLCGVPAWKSIHAVKNGNVKAVPHWLRMSWTPSGRSAIINELLELTGIPVEEAGYGT
nr:AraC family transcriptional regulator [Paenibacillus oenotherae]